MIHWLVQSTSDHPDLSEGTPPEGLLGPDELARFATLRTAKRRQDWLLGRWTAKHLLQSALDQEAGVRLPLDAIVVENDAHGVPRVNLALDQLDIKYWGRLSLSISHSYGQAFCALTTVPGGRVGADIERIEPRSGPFVADYFTAEEVARLPQEPGPERDALVTAVWSAKEAVLKALGLGLTVDTRRVVCLLDPLAATPDPVPLGYLWTRFAIQVHPDLLPASDQASVLSGWWHLMSNYVLTLVLISSGPVCHKAAGPE